MDCAPSKARAAPAAPRDALGWQLEQMPGMYRVKARGITINGLKTH